MTLSKLGKIIIIWLDEVINDKVIIWKAGSGKSSENRFYQTYDISSDDDSWRGRRARLYINTYKDGNKNVTFFTIGFDLEKGKTKLDNYEAFTVYPDGVTDWIGGYDLGDVDVSKHFSNDEIRKLKHMIHNADETLQDWLERNTLNSMWMKPMKECLEDCDDENKGGSV